MFYEMLSLIILSCIITIVFSTLETMRISDRLFHISLEKDIVYWKKEIEELEKKEKILGIVIAICFFVIISGFVYVLFVGFNLLGGGNAKI